MRLLYLGRVIRGKEPSDFPFDHLERCWPGSPCPRLAMHVRRQVMAGQVVTGWHRPGPACYGRTFQCRPASLRTCGMNESVIWSAGCRLPPTLSCTVPQGAGPCATASGAPPALARNVSLIPPPKAAGQEAPGPIVDSPSPSTSAASRRTTAGSVIVTGAGGRLACGFRLGSWVIVTARVAAGTHSVAGRGGCQLTWASTRIAVCPLPAPVTSTTISLLFSTPGTGESENMRSHEGGPKSSSAGVNRRGRCACSQASTACGRPGACQKEALSTSVVETRVVIGVLSAWGV